MVALERAYRVLRVPAVVAGDLSVVILQRRQRGLDVGDRRAGRADGVVAARAAAAAVVLDICLNLSVGHHLGVILGDPVTGLGLEPAVHRIDVVEAIADVGRAHAVRAGARLIAQGDVVARHLDHADGFLLAGVGIIAKVSRGDVFHHVAADVALIGVAAHGHGHVIPLHAADGVNLGNTELLTLLQARLRAGRGGVGRTQIHVVLRRASVGFVGRHGRAAAGAAVRAAAGEGAQLVDRRRPRNAVHRQLVVVLELANRLLGQAAEAAGDRAVVIIQLFEHRLQLGDGRALVALAQGRRHGAGADVHTRVLERAGDRVQRRRAGHAVLRQALRLLEFLDGLLRQVAVVAGHVAVVVAQRRQILLERADGRAGRAELHVRAAGAARRAARLVNRRRNRVERLRARDAVRRQALRLLEGLHGRLGLRAEVAGDFRIVIAELLQIRLKPADLRALAVQLKRRARAAAGSGRAALAGNRRRDGVQGLGARNAVRRQAVFLLEALHGRLGLRAEIAGDLRPVIAQRRQILLEVANVRALGIELEAACGGTRAGRAAALRLVGRVNLRDGLRAGNAVRRQAVLALKALDGRHGLWPRVAGDLAGVIAQRLQLGLHLADRRAAGIFADIGRIRIGGAGLALRRGERADRLAGQIAAAHLELRLGLIGGEHLHVGVAPVALADPARRGRTVAGAVFDLNERV